MYYAVCDRGHWMVREITDKDVVVLDLALSFGPVIIFDEKEDIPDFIKEIRGCFGPEYYKTYRERKFKREYK